MQSVYSTAPVDRAEQDHVQKKKTLWRQNYTKNVDMNVQWKWFSNLKA